MTTHKHRTCVRNLLTVFRPSASLGLLLGLGMLCSCGKTEIKPAAAYQPAQDPDPERGAENQIQQLLARLSTRENEVAAMIRSGGASFTPAIRSQARAEREKFYQQSEFISALRGAGAAIHDKMNALAAEQAALANSAVSNFSAASINVVSNAGNLPPDERVEEVNLKSHLFDLRNLMDELAFTSASDVGSNLRTREKAADIRADIYTPETYVAGLAPAIDLLEKKLRGMDAEAAVYEKLLGLVPVTHHSGRK